MRATRIITAAGRTFHRGNEIRRAARQLEASESPRLQMLLIVGLAAAFGFLTTVAMLHGGIEQLWIRYAVAVTLAYTVYISLLWYWLHGNSDDAIDFIDLSPPRGGCNGYGGSCDAPFRGGGGQFGGGGSTGSFDGASAPSPQFSSIDLTSGNNSSSLPDLGVGDLADVGEAWPLAVILAVVAGVIALLCAVFACLRIVWSAPVFMAELLVDAALARGLYRRMIGAKDGDWLQTALRHTFWPFLALVVLSVVAGLVMQVLVPGADSMGEFIRQVAQAH